MKSPFRHYAVNGFRARRGRVLGDLLVELADRLDRPISILDLGGQSSYWRNVLTDEVASRIDRLVLLNRSPEGQPPDLGSFVESVEGDACSVDLPDDSFDFVHSNSVIEHVGSWTAMAMMAAECRRLGAAGWVQTPAAGFPVEPHFHLPFVHWFNRPIVAAALRLSPIREIRQLPLGGRRYVADGVNLLSRGEVALLFPDCTIGVERLAGLPKSYVVRW